MLFVSAKLMIIGSFFFTFILNILGKDTFVTKDCIFMYRYSSTLIFFFCTSEQIPMRLDTEQKLIRFNVAIGKDLRRSHILD